MPWAGGEVVDVRANDGRPDAFTSYLAGSRMLFQVVTGSDGRLHHQQMVKPGHDIGYPCDYPRLRPPRRSTDKD
ncbi:hypothetical protein [Euzebya sp.]|uniref:hypothetical protein n=1 Tax=Euzebya sp. TaxID=1971409 RepID=UPI0035168CE3